MTKDRMEAFTDGVVAIVITIMVLDMKVPAGTNLAALSASAPMFLAYALSYVNVGLFWNNHHHMLHASHIAPLPTAAYGVVLTMAAIGYYVLERALIAVNGPDSKLAMAIGAEWKGVISVVIYFLAIPMAFVSPWLSIGAYVAVALVWFIPDRRIESRLKA